jgi:hypothetical protein
MAGTSPPVRAKQHASAERAARRAAVTGSGPVRIEGPIPMFPGATSWFALFGEVLLVGVLVAIASLPVVTLPAAVAAGTRHLRRYALADDAPLVFFWRDLRSALLGGIGIGFAALVAVGACLFDIGLAASDPSPIGIAMRLVGVTGLVVVAVGMLLAASLWTPEHGWSRAVGRLRDELDRDPAGLGYLVVVVGFVALITWQMAPLLVPGLGCAALALVAIPVRPRRS